jgi:putative acetyltransferase
MRIVEARESDLAAVLQVERDAFGREDEARLVADLLRDPTARPLVSLLAWEGEAPAGHVLFTHATLFGVGCEVPAALLAPLAVTPARQRRGIGRALVEHGAGLLASAGVQLVFVLGSPAYYPRCGFEPAIPRGLRAPYPIEPEPAWMVRALAPGVLGAVAGTLACAASLSRPESWRE